MTADCGRPSASQFSQVDLDCWRWVFCLLLDNGGAMQIWCCQCQTYVLARLTNGAEVYPHRPDLADIPRWRCDGCGNHVGTHHKTKNWSKPLGNIPSADVKRARIKIHELIDPVWKSGRISRRRLYTKMSAALGREYHTGEIKTIDEARNVYRVARDILNQI